MNSSSIIRQIKKQLNVDALIRSNEKVVKKQKRKQGKEAMKVQIR